MAKTYDLVFKAVDQFSGVANTIDGRLGSLFSRVSGLGGSFEGMGIKGTGALAALSLGVLAIGAAFVAVNAGIGLFNDQLDKSVKLQGDQALAAINVSNTANKSLDEADSIVNQVTQVVAEKTAKLPGITQKYVDIALVSLDNIAAFSKNQEEINNYSVKIATLFGTFGGDATPRQLKDVVSDVTSGQRTLNQTSNREFFVNNPALFNRFKKELAKEGLTEIKGAPQEKIFKALANIAPTDAEIKRLQNTFTSKVDTIFSDLFDPTIGILGFSKQLKTRGNKRVIDAATDALAEIVDIFESIGKILSKTGLTQDSALEAIYDGIGRLADFFQSVEDFLDNNSDRLAGILGVLGKIFNAIVFIDSAMISLNVEIAKILFDPIGSIIKAVRFIPDKIGEFLGSINSRAAEIYNNPLSLIPNGVKEKSGSFLNSGINAIGNVLSMGFLPNITGAKYGGNFPGLDFLKTENNFKPVGSQAVIANDSEFILTPNQMRNLVSNLQTAPIYNITVQANSEAQNIADTIVKTIDSHWQRVKLESF